MTTHLKTLELIRILGYDGDFPESLNKICNNSTSFIWDQFIQNVKSKKEVQNMKNNILVHRLNKNGLSLNKAGKSGYDLKEISTYLKKGDLEKDVGNLNYSITEKENTNQCLMHQNKSKIFNIEKINLKIKENENREFILREKLKLLEKDLQDAEHIFNFPMNSNLVDRNEAHNSKDIMQTLHRCEEGLEEQVKQLPLSKNTSNETINRLMFSTKKSVRKNNVFEQYLCLTEKRTGKKIKKRPQNKENFGSNKINIPLFLDDDRAETKQNKIDMSDRRESLEMHVEDNDDENFLIDLSKASFVGPHPSYKLSAQSPLIAIQEVDTSCLFNKTKNVSNHRETNESLLRAIFKECVAKDIANLLNINNRQNIWNIFRNIDDDIHFSISKKVNFRHVKVPSNKNRKLDDLARLHALHVKTELKIVKNKMLLKQLTEKVNKKKENVSVSLVNSGYPTDLIESLQKNLELKIEDIGLDCSLVVMKKEINNIQNSSKMADVSQLKKSLLEVKDGITLKKNSIIQYLDIVQEIFMAINRIRNTTSSCVRKLAPFTSDLSWCSLLVENINSHEIKVFEEFPLEYNRKFVNTDPSIYYKDIHTNKFLCNREIDNENLNMLISILGSPFSAPETVILNILRAKLKLDALKAIKPVERTTDFKKHSLKDLQAQESYMVNILDQFNALIASSTSKKTLSAANSSKKIMDLWIEMPFKDFISSSRKFEGKDYKSYEKMFDSFYSDL